MVRIITPSQQLCPSVGVYLDDELAKYAFPGDHPFGRRRLDSFRRALVRQIPNNRYRALTAPLAERTIIETFHDAPYVQRVIAQSVSGIGLLDTGDTPAFAGCYEATCGVVGAVVDAVDNIISGKLKRAFIPIAGLHHARRDGADGYCIFNDCAIAIQRLRNQHGIRRVAYIDIDAHHGDGVFYAYENDPAIYVVDLHEDGRFIYPGTGSTNESGSGAAEGTKLNLPLPPGCTDAQFISAWTRAEQFLEHAQPEFILLQSGADCLENDPLTHMRCTPAVHAHVTRSVAAIASRHSGGRVLALGGGGYNLRNISRAWTAVVDALCAA